MLICSFYVQLPYAGDTRGRGQLIVNNNKDDDDDDAPVAAGPRNKRKPTLTVPCFPLETILAALNRSRVDYFSLDIEGFELPVLKTIDWTRTDIRVLSVEFNRGKVGCVYIQCLSVFCIFTMLPAMLVTIALVVCQCVCLPVC